jgi:FAS-associated factor 2
MSKSALLIQSQIWQWIPGPLFSFVSFPFHILASTVRYIFGTLRIPFPHLPFTSLNYNRLRSGISHPRGGVDRWIRQLEEETGAVCLSRARNSSHSITSSAEVGPSVLKSRPVIPEFVSDGNRKILPDFCTTSYDEALRICQKEARIGCIILVSEEHDDVPEFKRSVHTFSLIAVPRTKWALRTTLTNAAFVKFLYDNDILVWGGDVRDQEAWAGKLAPDKPTPVLD